MQTRQKLLFVNVVEQKMFSNLNLLKQNKSQHREKIATGGHAEQDG